MLPVLRRALVSILLASFTCLPALAADPSPDGSTLSLQVTALRTLYALDLSPQQLQKLKSLAQGAADTSSRKPGKVSEALRKGLDNVKSAILTGKDDDAINDLEDDLDELWDNETFDVTDGVDLTDKARSSAASALALLKADQAASYVGAINDDIADPVDALMSAAEDSAGADEDEFKQTRDTTAEDVAASLGGVDKKKTADIQKKVADFLTAAHQIASADFAAKRDELEKQARAIAGDNDPMAIIRNQLLRSLGEMLANPQLEPMIDALEKAPPSTRPEK